LTIGFGELGRLLMFALMIVELEIFYCQKKSSRLFAQRTLGLNLKAQKLAFDRSDEP